MNEEPKKLEVKELPACQVFYIGAAQYDDSRIIYPQIYPSYEEALRWTKQGKVYKVEIPTPLPDKGENK